MSRLWPPHGAVRKLCPGEDPSVTTLPQAEPLRGPSPPTARDLRTFALPKPHASSAPPSSSSFAPSRDVPTLFFAGRLIREKGIFDVIDAISILERRTPCRLVVAGEGPERARLAARIREHDLDDAVTLVGHLSDEQLTAA